MMKRQQLPLLFLSLLMTSPVGAFDGLLGADQLSPAEEAVADDAFSPPSPTPLQTALERSEYEFSSIQQEQPTQFFTRSELREETKKLVWTKGNLKIIPYGRLWGSIAYDTERTSPRRFTLWVDSEQDQGESQFVIDTRRTRLGIDIEGPRIPLFDCARFRGKVETDFYGRFITENQPDMRLRHAYGEIKNDSFRLLAGQTWDLISPLWPGTINFPVGWAAGNIGFRRMQVRLEKYYRPSDGVVLEVAGAIADSVVVELSSVTGVNRETSNWPLLEGRIGAKLAGLTSASSPVTLGISAHIGEEGFDFTADAPPPADDVRVQTWSVNLDVRIPMADRWGIQGEFFTGKNLATFLGGIVQGVDSTTRDGIRSTGGWVECWYDWTPQWHSHGGYSVENPRDGDMTSASARTFNQFFFLNTSYDITKNLNFGFEVSHWTTKYLAKSAGKAVRYEFAGMYKF